MSRQNVERIGLLQLMVPELFAEPGTVLYVGAYARRFAGSKPLYQTGHEITVLEVWPEFLEGLKASRFNQRVAHYVEGDVIEVDQLELPHRVFDYTIWLHGPEHIGIEHFVPTVRKLEKLTKHIIVLGCPWGWAPHGIAYDNPHTQHKSYYYAEHFQRLGYRTAAIGPRDKLGSHLLGWKIKRT